MPSLAVNGAEEALRCPCRGLTRASWEGAGHSPLSVIALEHFHEGSRPPHFAAPLAGGSWPSGWELWSSWHRRPRDAFSSRAGSRAAAGADVGLQSSGGSWGTGGRWGGCGGALAARQWRLQSIVWAMWRVLAGSRKRVRPGGAELGSCGGVVRTGHTIGALCPDPCPPQQCGQFVAWLR